MNTAKVANAPSSGTTSSAALNHPRPNREREYLNRQAADATAALAHTAQDLGKQLRHTAQAHPVLALGVAAVGGALLGRTLAGRGRNTEHPPAPRPSAPPSFLIGLVNDTLKPLVPGLIAAALAALQAREPARPEPPAR